MYRYLWIESKQPLLDTKTVIIDLLSEIIEIKEIIENERSLLVFFEHDIQFMLEEFILNIVSDTFIDLRIYEPHGFDDPLQRELHKEYLLSLLHKIPFSYAPYLNDRLVLKFALEQNIKTHNKFFLRKFYQDHEMIKTIKVYLELNQNMTQASKELFMHRNTLILRLDKFHQTTGFDIRKFLDAFIIYHIL